MPEKTHSDGHPNQQPGEGVRNRRKLSWDDYNPAHVESGRLESFPVMAPLPPRPPWPTDFRMGVLLPVWLRQSAWPPTRIARIPRADA
jgi:hypothetical protein